MFHEDTPGEGYVIEPPTREQTADRTFAEGGPADLYRQRSGGRDPSHYSRAMKKANAYALEIQAPLIEQGVEFDPDKFTLDLMAGFMTEWGGVSIGGDTTSPDFTGLEEDLGEEAKRQLELQKAAALELGRRASLRDLRLEGVAGAIPKYDVPEKGVGALPTKAEAEVAAEEAGLPSGASLQNLDPDFGLYGEYLYKPPSIPEGYLVREMNVYQYAYWIEKEKWETEEDYDESIPAGTGRMSAPTEEKARKLIQDKHGGATPAHPMGKRLEVRLKPGWRGAKEKADATWIVEPTPMTWNNMLQLGATAELKTVLAIYFLQKRDGLTEDEAIEILKKEIADSKDDLEEQRIEAAMGRGKELTADDYRRLEDALKRGDSPAGYIPGYTQAGVDVLVAMEDQAIEEVVNKYHRELRREMLGTSEEDVGSIQTQISFEKRATETQKDFLIKGLEEQGKRDLERKRSTWQASLDAGVAKGERWAVNHMLLDYGGELWHEIKRDRPGWGLGTDDPYLNPAYRAADEVMLDAGMVPAEGGGFKPHWSVDPTKMKERIDSLVAQEMASGAQVLRKEDIHYIVRSSLLRAEAGAVIDLENATPEVIQAAQGGPAYTIEGKIEAIMEGGINGRNSDGTLSRGLDREAVMISRARLEDPRWGETAKIKGWELEYGLPAHRAMYFWLSKEGRPGIFADADYEMLLQEYDNPQNIKYFDYAEEAISYSSRGKPLKTGKTIGFTGPRDPEWKEQYQKESRIVASIREEMLKTSRSGHPEQLVSFQASVHNLKIASRNVKEGAGGENMRLDTVFDAEDIGNTKRAVLRGWRGVSGGGTPMEAKQEDYFATLFREKTGLDPWPRRHELYVDRTASTPFRIDYDILQQLKIDDPDHPMAQALSSVDSWVEAWHEIEYEYKKQYPNDPVPFRWSRSVAHNPYIVWPVTIDVYNDKSDKMETLYVDPENNAVSVYPIPVSYIGAAGVDIDLNAATRQLAVMGTHLRTEKAEQRFRRGVVDPNSESRFVAVTRMSANATMWEKGIESGEFAHAGMREALRYQKGFRKETKVAPFWAHNFVTVERIEGLDPVMKVHAGTEATNRYGWDDSLRYQVLPNAEDSFGQQQIDAYKNDQLFAYNPETRQLELISFTPVTIGSEELDPGVSKAVNKESLYTTRDDKVRKLYEKLQAEQTRKVQENMNLPVGSVLVRWLEDGTTIKLRGIHEGDPGMVDDLRSTYYQKLLAEHMGTRDIGDVTVDQIDEDGNVTTSGMVSHAKYLELQAKAEEFAWIDITRIMSGNRGLVFYDPDPADTLKNVFTYTPALRPFMAAWASKQGVSVHFPSSAEAWARAGISPLEMDPNQMEHRGVKRIPVQKYRITHPGTSIWEEGEEVWPSLYQDMRQEIVDSIVGDPSKQGDIPEGVRFHVKDEDGNEMYQLAKAEPDEAGAVLPISEFTHESALAWLNKLFPMTIIGNQSRTLLYGIQTDWYAVELEKLAEENFNNRTYTDHDGATYGEARSRSEAHSDARWTLQTRIVTGNTGNGAIDSMMVQNVNEGRWFSENMNDMMQEAVNAGTDLEGADLWDAQRTGGRIGEVGGWIVDLGGPDPFTASFALGRLGTKGLYKLYNVGFRYKTARNPHLLRKAQSILDNPQAHGLAADALMAERHKAARAVLTRGNPALPFIVEDRIGARLLGGEGELLDVIRAREAELATDIEKQVQSAKSIWDDVPSFRIAAEDEVRLIRSDLVEATSQVETRQAKQLSTLDKVRTKRAKQKKPKPVTIDNLRAELKLKGPDQFFGDPRIYQAARLAHPDDVDAFLVFGHSMEQAQAMASSSASILEHSLLTLGEQVTRDLIAKNPELALRALDAPIPVLTQSGRKLAMQGLGNARMTAAFDRAGFVPHNARLLDDAAVLERQGAKEFYESGVNWKQQALTGYVADHSVLARATDDYIQLLTVPSSRRVPSSTPIPPEAVGYRPPIAGPPVPEAAKANMIPRRGAEAKKAEEAAKKVEPLALSVEEGKWEARQGARPTHGSWELDNTFQVHRAAEFESVHAERVLETFQAESKANASAVKHYDDTITTAEAEIKEVDEQLRAISDKYKGPVGEHQAAIGAHGRASDVQITAEKRLAELQENSIARRKAQDRGEVKPMAPETQRQMSGMHSRAQAAIKTAKEKTAEAFDKVKTAEKALEPYTKECAQPGKIRAFAEERIKSAVLDLNQKAMGLRWDELTLIRMETWNGDILTYPKGIGKWYDKTEKSLKGIAKEARLAKEAAKRKVDHLEGFTTAALTRHQTMVSRAVDDTIVVALQQDELARVGQVYGDLADELQDGMNALKTIPEGIANGMRPSAGTLERLRRSLQGSERQGSAYDWIATFTAKEDKRTLGRTVQITDMFNQIDSIYGKGVRKQAMARAAGAKKGATIGGIATDTLSRLRKTWKSQGRPKVMQLEATEVIALHGLPEELHRIYLQTHPKAAGIVLVDLLENVAKDPALRRLVEGKTGIIGRVLERMRNSFQDPASAVIGGKFNEDMVAIVKSAQHLIDHMNTDLYFLGRRARSEWKVTALSDDVPRSKADKLLPEDRLEKSIAIETRKLLRDYVTWDATREAPMALRTGVSVGVPTSLRDPLWYMFLHNSLTDPAMLPLTVKEKRAADALMKRIRVLEKKKRKGKISTSQAEELQEIYVVETVNKEIARHKARLRALTKKEAKKLEAGIKRDISTAEKDLKDLPSWKDKWLTSKYGARWNESPLEGNTFAAWATHWIPSGTHSSATPGALDSVVADAYKILEDTATKARKGEFANPKASYDYADNRLKAATRAGSREFIPVGARGRINIGHHFDVDKDLTRATASGTMAISSGAIKQHTWEMASRRITGTVTSAEVAASARLWDASYTSLKESEVIAGYSIMNKMGVPVTSSYYRTPTQAQRYHYLQKIAVDSDGRDLILPQSVVKAVEDSLNVQRKEIGRLFQHSAEKGELDLLTFQSRFNTHWKQSVITGTFIPRPAYVMTNLVGDTSQMMFELGAVLGGQVSFNTVTSLPWWNNRFGKALDEMTDTLLRKRKGRGPQGEFHILASPSSALYNTWANKIWRGEKGIIRTAHGEVIDLQVLRQELREAVLDTQVHEELLRFLTDVTKGGMGAAFTRYSDDIRWIAQHLQQRMRGNLYMELRIRRGYTRKEAIQAVQDALYDWKHGITKAEVAHIAKYLPFWRFWRLAGKQMYRRLAEPFTKPNKALLDSFTGRSALSRIRLQLNVRDRLYDGIIDPEILGRIRSEEEWTRDMERMLRPEWMLGRALLGHQVSPDPDFWIEQKGAPYKYEAMIAPPMTITDIAELFGSWSLFVGGALAHRYDGAEPRPLSPTGTVGMSPWGTPTPVDWEKYLIEPSLNLMFPRFKEVLQDSMEAAGIDTGGYKKGELQNVNDAEYAIANTWDSIFSTKISDRQDMEMADGTYVEGRPQMHRYTKLFMDAVLPWVSVEAAGFLNNTYYHNPYVPQYGDLQRTWRETGGNLAQTWDAHGPKGMSNGDQLMAAGWRALGNYTGFKWHAYQESGFLDRAEEWDINDSGQIVRHRAWKAQERLGELRSEIRTPPSYAYPSGQMKDPLRPSRVDPYLPPAYTSPKHSQYEKRAQALADEGNIEELMRVYPGSKAARALAEE